MAAKNLLQIAEQAGLKEHAETFGIGDTVDVHLRIVEGEKERIQVFTGTVIGTKGAGANRSFTVRRLVGTEGVERVFPLHCPSIEKIEVRKKGRVRRAKLYYLRQRIGKATRVAEKLGIEGAAGAEEPLPIQQALKPREAALKAQQQAAEQAKKEGQDAAEKKD
jgi:large subunit ribosomal protein L19